MKFEIKCHNCGTDLETVWDTGDDGTLYMNVKPCWSCFGHLFNQKVQRDDIGIVLKGKEDTELLFTKVNGAKRCLTGHYGGYSADGVRLYFYDTTDEQLKSVYVDSIIALTVDGIDYEVFD